MSFTSQKYTDFDKTREKVMSIMKKLNDDILGEIETGTREYERKFKSMLIDFAAMSNRRWHPHKFNGWTKVDVIADTISRKCKHFTYRFYTNMYRKFLNNFIFIYKTDYYTIYFNSRHLHFHSSVRSLHLFACHGNAGTQNIYNRCRT